jgi:hypothetical protein
LLDVGVGDGSEEVKSDYTGGIFISRLELRSHLVMSINPLTVQRTVGGNVHERRKFNMLSCKRLHGSSVPTVNITFAPVSFPYKNEM